VHLRYGTNPDQAASLDDHPVLRVLTGQPSLINVLDALTAWQLVRAAAAAVGRPAAASFKHVSPAGAAVAGPLDDVMRATWDIDGEVSDIASAYVRARDADPKCSFSDGVTTIVEPGGSTRTTAVDTAAADHGITLVRTGLRLFHH
jgi:phosphoribosylaminoimidazolecarboxamide formyltransferase/IMP cyclohydrolase